MCKTASTLEKHQSGTIDISLNVKEAHLLKKRELTAYVIGFINLSPNFRYQPELFRRPSAAEIQPAKLKLTATIEKPRFRMLTPPDELCFIINAFDVCKCQFVTRFRKLVFLNEVCDVNTSVTTTEPFKIEEIVQAGTEETYDNFVSKYKEIIVRIAYI